MIACLTGGVGGAKFALGLARILAPDELSFIVNTGDDFEFLGLRISPDVDTLIYSLAGVVNPTTGWGLAGDSFRCLQALRRHGAASWFRLGDIDLATHLVRSEMLRQGQSLSQVVQKLARDFGVRNQILPPTDAFVPTFIRSGVRRLHLQEYFVKERCTPRVDALEYQGAQDSLPAPGVVSLLSESEAIIIGPSNPLISIDPILAIPQIRETIASRRRHVVAVSPIVAGKAIKGPAAKMMDELGLGSSAAAVALHYAELVDVFVLDQQDEALAQEIERRGIKVVVTNTIMNSLESKISLAKTVLDAIRTPRD